MTRVPITARRFLLLSLVAATAACGRMQAKTPAPVAALNMPPPPARLLIPVELPEPAPETPEPEAPATPPPAPSRPRETATRPATTTTAPPATAPATDTPAAAVLQTTPQASATEERVKALIASADSNLRSVSYRDLGENARAQYDAARSYIRQASDAVKAKNYVFAEFLANKASDLVRLLVRG
jgi:hypothetical protein